MQDAAFHRVKQIYWGIRVLPVSILNLDYESSLARWESTENQLNQTTAGQPAHRMPLLYTVWCRMTVMTALLVLHIFS